MLAMMQTFLHVAMVAQGLFAEGKCFERVRLNLLSSQMYLLCKILQAVQLLHKVGIVYWSALVDNLTRVGGTHK
jgi:hypothetical protein